MALNLQAPPASPLQAYQGSVAQARGNPWWEVYPSGIFHALGTYGGAIFGGSFGGSIYRSTTGNRGSWVWVYDDADDRDIYDFVEFGGDFYACSIAPDASAGIFRTSDGVNWGTVFEDANYDHFHSLAAHGAAIYAGGHGPNDLGVLVSSGTGDLNDWAEVYEHPTEAHIPSALSWGGSLYIGTYPGGLILEGGVLRCTTGDTAVWSLCVLGANLYAGTRDAGKILRTADGTTWTTVDTGWDGADMAVHNSWLHVAGGGEKAVLSSDTGNSGDWRRQHVHHDATSIVAAVSFGSHLYVGTTTGIFRRKFP